MNLRPYQQAARDAVFREWDLNRRTLLVLPTGTGKTIVFAAVVEQAVREGKRALILAHRGELLDQAADKLKAATGLACAVEKAEQTSLGAWNRVVVGSVQTLSRPRRLEQFSPDHFGAIVIDEAHHALSDTYRRILDHFTTTNVLGVTATPDRSDMRNLGQYFDSLAYEYTLPAAIRDGWLSPIRALTIPLKLDISGVTVTNGDYSAGELGDALSPYLDAIADEMAKACQGRKTVVFLPLVRTSQHFRDVLIARGIRAAEVNGESPDRAQIIADFAAGKYDVLCNSMLLTEGWDCPAVDCIAVLRPTKSRALYCQMVGRGTRLAEGKDHLLLLDFLWLTSKHELCRPAALICENADVAQKMTENLEQAAGPVDLEQAEKDAASDVAAQREAALADELARMRRRKRQLVDPLQFAASICAPDIADYQPSFSWQVAKSSEKQKDALEKFGIYSGEIETTGEASKILDTLIARKMAGLTTPRQIRFLEARGFRHVGTWPFDAAKGLIDRIAANHWQVPYTISPATYKPENPNIQRGE